MLRHRVMGGRRLIEVYEEIKGVTNWTVPPGCESVDAFVVAGGQYGGNSTIYSAGLGGGGGECATFRNIKVTPGASIKVVIGGIGSASYFWNGSYQVSSGKGGKGGTNYQEDGFQPTPGGPGGNGSYAFGEPSARFPHRYGAGGGAGAYVRGFSKGYINGGAGGDYGGGAGAGDDDTDEVHHGKPGGNATFYGGGGGGASKASKLEGRPGTGGKGFPGIVILHYWKYNY